MVCVRWPRRLTNRETIDLNTGTGADDIVKP